MKIQATYQTEVFINDNGYIAIGQACTPVGDPLVELSRHQAWKVARELLRLANEDNNWPDDSSKDAD